MSGKDRVAVIAFIMIATAVIGIIVIPSAIVIYIVYGALTMGG